MSIHEVKDFLLICIQSCKTSVHCETMLRMIQWALLDKYESEIPTHELEIIKKELMDALIDQKAAIVWSNKPPEAPTLFLHERKTNENY